MKILTVLSIGVLFACQAPRQTETHVSSPDQSISLNFYLNDKGQPVYNVTKGSDTIITNSILGFKAQELDFSENFSILKSETTKFSETWETVWGQSSAIENTYNGLTLYLKNEVGNLMNIAFRVFDDGVGFRYEFPEQGNHQALVISDELTTFGMSENHTTWWVPGCWDNDEYVYTQSRLSEVDGSFFQKGYPYSHATTITHKNSVNTPVTMKTSTGKYISIHEAALVNFPGMSLVLDTLNYVLKSHLAEADSTPNIKAVIDLPYKTPWRTIQIGDDAGELILSNLILNLNEPNKIKDTDWIKPSKYMGIWWEMHIGKSSWGVKGGKHGATTENAKGYIDFCSANGIPALLIEGWNTGWDDLTGENRENVFDFQTPSPDFDLKEVVRYGKEKGVEIVGHHETSSGVETYEKYMDSAYQYYQDLGIRYVKTGYVGKIPNHRHYDQHMVNHYNKTMEKTAAHHIMLHIHEPIKPTGLCRTYPNLMSAEGMRGQEFNAWSDGNKLSHNVILPFTRNLAGPMDFTPGIFDVRLLKYKNKPTASSSADAGDGEAKTVSRVYSTLAHQLGLFVVFYSPVQMVADLPENYEGNPAFQFIKDVGVDWDWTKVLDAEVASHLVIARKERGKDNWFIGGITGDNAHTTTIQFDFLPKGKTFKATVYADDPSTDYLLTPEKYVVREMDVSSESKLEVEMKKAGGFAISIIGK